MEEEINRYCCEEFKNAINELVIDIDIKDDTYFISYEEHVYTGCGERETYYHDMEIRYCPFCGVRLGNG